MKLNPDGRLLRSPQTPKTESHLAWQVRVFLSSARPSTRSFGNFICKPKTKKERKVIHRAQTKRKAKLKRNSWLWRVSVRFSKNHRKTNRNIKRGLVYSVAISHNIKAACLTRSAHLPTVRLQNTTASGYQSYWIRSIFKQIWESVLSKHVGFKYNPLQHVWSAVEGSGPHFWIIFVTLISPSCS